MLQQTQVATVKKNEMKVSVIQLLPIVLNLFFVIVALMQVIAFYERWMQRFPTIQALADVGVVCDVVSNFSIYVCTSTALSEIVYIG